MIATAVVFALLLGAFIFAVLPHAGLARRALSTGLFVALIALVYGGGIEMLGRPKPMRLEWRPLSADAKVLGALPVENQAIYLWVEVPDASEPRSYVLPWSLEQAQQLQEARNQAEANGTGVRMSLSLEGGIDVREPKFYALPRPALPAKDYDSAAPVIFQQPDQAS
jgi:hypothetical protein